MRRTISTDERGSALVLALVMLSVIGLVVAAGVTYAGTSLASSNVAIRPQRASAYAADGAVQTAIEHVHDNAPLGADLLRDSPNNCFTSAVTYTPTSGGPVSVDVCPQPDSFIHQGNYRAVLLTLGTNANEGIRLSHTGNVNIGGDVWSNSRITLQANSMVPVAAGRVWAWGSCNRVANITTDAGYSKVCNATTGFGGVRPKVALDPATPSLGHTADWQPAAVPASLTQPAIPACVANAATLQPGVYYDPAALSALTTTCTNVTLGPGVYFLNFPNQNALWTIGAGRSVTAACDGTGQGAQLVFGNRARITLDGTLTIPCGRRATAQGPRIALYGLSTGVGAAGPFATTLRPTTVSQAGNNLFAPATLNDALPGALPGYPQDGTNATATVAQNNRTAQLIMNNFTPSTGPALPSNAQLTSAIVRVGHDETAGTTFPSNQSRLVWGSCTVNFSPVPAKSSPPGAPTLYTSPNLAASLSACGSFNPTLVPRVQWTVRTTSGTAQTIRVDGSQLDVTWTSPGVLPQSGCVTTVGGCSLVVPPASGGTLATQDVIYLPNNLLSGRFNLSGGLKLGVAVILRTINANIVQTAGSTQAIGFDPNPRTNGDVLLRAQIAGSPWLSARVTYPNGGSAAPSVDAWIAAR